MNMIYNGNIIYEIKSDQHQLEWQRTRDIESKAVNIVLFSGVILGLEFNVLQSFYNSMLGTNTGSLYYLIALSSSLFISAILLGIVILTKSRHHCVADLMTIIDKCNEDDEKIDQMLSRASSKLSDNIKQNDEKNKLKSIYLTWSFITFFSGILTTIVLFGYIFRFIFYL